MANRTIHMTPRGFPSPFEISGSPGLRGMGGAVPRYLRFARVDVPSRRAGSGSRMRCTRRSRTVPVRRRLDRVGVVGFSQASARLFVVPPSLGLECRILNGYVYMSPQLGHRRGDDRATGGAVREYAAATTTSTGTSSTTQWVDKVEAAIAELQALEVPELPEVRGRVGRHRGTRRRLELHAARRLRPSARGTRPRSSSTTSSCSTSATVPTSSSTSSAARRSRTSRTRRSRRWSRASTSSCSARTTSSGASPRLAVELGIGDIVTRADGEEALRAALDRERARRAVAGRLRADEGSLVLLLLRERASTTTTAPGSTTRRSRSR